MMRSCFRRNSSARSANQHRFRSVRNWAAALSDLRWRLTPGRYQRQLRKDGANSTRIGKLGQEAVGIGVDDETLNVRLPNVLEPGSRVWVVDPALGLLVNL